MSDWFFRHYMHIRLVVLIAILALIALGVDQFVSCVKQTGMLVGFGPGPMPPN